MKSPNNIMKRPLTPPCEALRSPSESFIWAGNLAAMY
jgi:hypothetical protein